MAPATAPIQDAYPLGLTIHIWIFPQSLLQTRLDSFLVPQNEDENPKRPAVSGNQ